MLLRAMPRPATPATWREEVTDSFAQGYQLALTGDEPHRVASMIDGLLGPFWRPYAYEGAGMAATMYDLLTTEESARLGSLVDFAGDLDTFVWLGAGCALARLGQGIAGLPREPGEDVAGVVADGFGFHVGYFESWRLGGTLPRPAVLPGLGREFDHGVGRSIWFVREGRAGDIVDAVARFDPARQADVWHGVGVAAAFTGGVGAEELDQLAAAGASALSAGARLGCELRTAVSGPSEGTLLASERLAEH